jgi:hypothetical protein
MKVELLSNLTDDTDCVVRQIGDIIEVEKVWGEKPWYIYEYTPSKHYYLPGALCKEV